jgi:CRP/FNR family cyclic AMP-dependent transcriptional regulator
MLREPRRTVNVHEKLLPISKLCWELKYACAFREALPQPRLAALQEGKSSRYTAWTGWWRGVIMQLGKNESAFDVMKLLGPQIKGRTLLNYSANQIVYSQGDPADSVFYIYKGKVKVTVISGRGKEVTVAIRGPDEFCGEGALTGKPRHLATVTAITAGEIVRLTKKAMAGLIHREEKFADYFLFHLLARTARVESDLVDQLFNGSEMRLVRALLLLANYGGSFDQEPLPIQVNQETLAELIGTTRSRVNFFLNKFRKLGLIDYNGKLHVHKELLNFFLHQQPHIST